MDDDTGTDYEDTTDEDADDETSMMKAIRCFNPGVNVVFSKNPDRVFHQDLFSYLSRRGFRGIVLKSTEQASMDWLPHGGTISYNEEDYEFGDRKNMLEPS
jgi:hypothetical protein